MASVVDRGTVDGGAEQLARDLAGNVIELIRLHTEYRMENKINDTEYRIKHTPVTFQIC